VRSLDTNVVVRFILNDDPAQFRVADRLMDGDVMLTTTVLLETAWLLRSRYRMSRREIGTALLAVVNISNVAVVDEPLVRWAIERMIGGGDFADMLHLVQSREARAFATFDRGVARAAGADAPIAIETLEG
jgi:predicted nucleic-acid-binding protein